MDGTAESERPVFDLERLVFFSDAIFAIVITLLVLPLTTEVDFLQGRDLGGEVWDLWPHVVSFVVSFLVIGQFWMVHHRMFGRLAGCDVGLVRLSLVSLLTVTFLPFPSALLGEHTASGDRFPVVFYAVSLAVTSITFTATWLHAVRGGLVDPRLSPGEQAEITARSFVASGVFVIAVGVSFLGLLPAALCWLVLLPLVRLVVIRRQRAGAVAT
jgi:uncharacterized membrane protein